MTQQGLADRLNALGAQIDRTAVAKVENGTRELSLAEAFMFAQALHVAPVNLFVPTDSTEPINIGPNLEASPAEVRAWIRGYRPMPFQDPRLYFTAVPKVEFPEAHEALTDWLQTAPINFTTTESEDER